MQWPTLNVCLFDSLRYWRVEVCRCSENWGQIVGSTASIMTDALFTRCYPSYLNSLLLLINSSLDVVFLSYLVKSHCCWKFHSKACLFDCFKQESILWIGSIVYCTLSIIVTCIAKFCALYTRANKFSLKPPKKQKISVFWRVCAKPQVMQFFLLLLINRCNLIYL